MKKFVFLTALLLVCAMLFSACGPKQVDNPTEPTDSSEPVAESTEAEETATLDIYYLADDACSHYMVNSFNYFTDDVTVNATAFASIEEMDTRIAAEVNANKGPDVIVFPNTTTLDTTKMAMNGAFLDLSEMLANDETFDAKNYYSLLDAGYIDDQQLMMPLQFALPYFLTTQERMAAMGMELPEKYTASQLMSAFQTAAPNLSDDYGVFAYYDAWMTGGGIIYDPLRFAGIEIADLQEQMLTVSEEVFREYAAYAKFAFVENNKTLDLYQKYGNTFTGGVAHTASIYYCRQILVDFRDTVALFKEGANETMELLTLPNYEDPTALTAEVTVYAAVLQSTDDPQTAYRFIRYGMDSILSDPYINLPISRAQVSAHLDELSWNRGSTSYPNVTVSVPPMTAEQRQLCEQTLDSITSGSIRNSALDEIFTSSMDPYIQGEAEFEECYTKFKNQMNLYLYE